MVKNKRPNTLCMRLSPFYTSTTEIDLLGVYARALPRTSVCLRLCVCVWLHASICVYVYVHSPAHVHCSEEMLECARERSESHTPLVHDQDAFKVGGGTLSTGVSTGFPAFLRISWAAVFAAKTGRPTRSICFWNAEGALACAV